MATELFSLWGGFTGWRSQHQPVYDVTGELHGISTYYYYSDDCNTVERAFYRACSRTFLRRYFPWIRSPARAMRIIVRHRVDEHYDEFE